MKKILLVILCLCMTISISAHDSNEYIFDYDDVGITIEFEENNSFSAAERQLIADLLVYGNTEYESSSTYALCWLTGHDYQYDYVLSVHHRVLEKAPRCEQTTYEVETCSKCDHVEYTAINSVYIACCPEE